eukprot:6230536-Pyramimonas_sp.AAC.1
MIRLAFSARRNKPEIYHNAFCDSNRPLRPEPADSASVLDAVCKVKAPSGMVVAHFEFDACLSLWGVAFVTRAIPVNIQNVSL